jgi:hypothetical protein
MCIVWFAAGAFATESADRWKVENISLKPRAELIEGTSFSWNDLTLNVLDVQRRAAFTLSAKVALSEVREPILYGNKLAIVGIAGNTEEVVIFDLSRRTEIDWFYCNGAKQIIPGKLVIAEFQPNHLGGVLLDDVLMLYDLSKSPSENRIKAARNTHYPLPVGADGEGVTEIGIPIYPQDNANEGNYFQTPRGSGEAVLMVYLDTMVALAPERLLFVAQRETDAAGAVTWLEVLDLPRGVTKAKSRRIEIPKKQLHPDPRWVKLHQPFNPNLVQISQIEVISPAEVRLHVPAEEYGVDHLDVQIPDSQ